MSRKICLLSYYINTYIISLILLLVPQSNILPSHPVEIMFADPQPRVMVLNLYHESELPRGLVKSQAYWSHS